MDLFQQFCLDRLRSERRLYAILQNRLDLLPGQLENRIQPLELADDIRVRNHHIVISKY